MWIRGVEAEPGEDIAHACAEALRIAQHMGMTVFFDFNGVSICARIDRNVTEMVEAYHKAISRDSKIKVA